jgi:hypothetical protein
MVGLHNWHLPTKLAVAPPILAPSYSAIKCTNKVISTLNTPPISGNNKKLYLPVNKNENKAG